MAKRHPPAAAPTTPEALVRAWYAALGRRDGPAETALRTRTFRAHCLGDPVPLDAAGWAAAQQALAVGFPDGTITVQDVVAAGAKVAVRWRFVGHHTGPCLGHAPTGRRITLEGLDLVRVAGRGIAELWTAQPKWDLLHQLGAVTVDDPRAADPADPADAVRVVHSDGYVR